MHLPIRFVKLGLLAASVLGGPVCQSRVAIVLTPAHDSYVNSQYPDANYGTEAGLFVHAGSNTKRAYLQFDLGAVPVEAVTGLSLRLLYAQAAPGGTVIDLHHVEDDGWEETSLTWHSMPAPTMVPLATASVQMGKAELAFTLPLGLLKEDADGRVSLLLKLADEGLSDTATFFSKEATVPLAVAPELILSVPEPRSAMGLAGVGLVIWTFLRRRQG
jgi:hypothetical protein